MTRKQTRREFLMGRLAGLSPYGGAVPGELARSEAYWPACLVHVSRRAMACQFQVFLNAGQYPHGVQAAVEALDLLEVLEQQMSFFRPDSLLQRINQEAALGPVEVEPGLFGLLQLADQIYQLTEGAFDLTATAFWEVWGFAQRQPRLPTEAELAEARQRVGWHYVHLNPADRTIRFTRPGIRLNLGSIGKGYALDCCAERLLQAGIVDFIIHGGQSSLLAHGKRLDSPSLGWPVGLRHPIRPNCRLGQLVLKDQALATSGSAVQFFYSGGRRYGHIIDPRTGQPGGEGILSVTVLAPSAAEADALATAMFLLGPEKSMQICQRRPDLAALFVLRSPKSAQMQIIPIGIAPPFWQPSTQIT
ncbi:MAG: FAD:protein FMN transferase [Thermoguttaceae bacterium]|nr:FAD:protein FMN transferase [Thermoguttaceae bacterium]MDW8036859.1 FAD:protein FMN transferase [Thermoguttaceae bacterium]